MYKIDKIDDPILIDKRHIRWKYFYLEVKKYNLDQ
jgi:hypothetical protein